MSKRQVQNRSQQRRGVQVNQGLTGINLYTDNKGRLIYYYPLQHKAWYIAKFDQTKFTRYKSRYILAVAAFMVLVTILDAWFSLPLWIPLVISLLFLLGLEYSFYKFINGCQPVKKFRKEELQHTYDVEITKDARTKYYLKITLYLVLGVLLVVNAYQEQYSTFLIVCCWLALVFCFFQAGFLVYQLSKATKIS